VYIFDKFVVFLQAMLVLRAGLSAGEAVAGNLICDAGNTYYYYTVQLQKTLIVAAATVVLEDSGIVNAGRGSSLTECRTVECDAGFMIGSGHFGAVGAAPGIPNPILAAKQIAEMRAEKPLLSCGRVPPT
jgi:isoaspartyl peptidase/L-asparaginase-like protein (Ntn-hydrolase superfamily)